VPCFCKQACIYTFLNKYLFMVFDIVVINMVSVLLFSDVIFHCVKKDILPQKWHIRLRVL